jgi:hypothetical protein
MRYFHNIKAKTKERVTLPREGFEGKAGNLYFC